MSARIPTLAVAALLAVGCATPIPSDREEAFAFAVEATQEKTPELTAQATWMYLSGATQDDPRYDRALRLMARSTEALGLTYAASTWHLEIARARREVTLLPGAIRGLERIVMGGPHDEEAIVRGFLGAADVTGLPDDVQAFVDYQQGLANARAGLEDWSRARFDRIPETSPYRARADYVAAVRLVAARRLDDAMEAFTRLHEREGLPEDLAIDVRRSLARLHFERRAWKEALEHYEAIRQAAPHDPELLLEMAWTHYHAGESRRTLGLLVALDAPVYRDLIAPERFLLEALSLRRLCQFGPARQSAVRLQARHGDALDDIYTGLPLPQSDALRNAAGLRGATRSLARFRRQLQRERILVEQLAPRLGESLTKHLLGRYDRRIAEARRQEAAQMAPELDVLADDLLAAEEGVRLILHELGVSLLRGRRRPEGARVAGTAEVPTGGDRSYFRFGGEFWTDELDDLVVFAEDRCID